MKGFIMLVRLVGTAAIVLGILLWNSGSPDYLGLHMAAGFLLVCLVLAMAAMAFARRVVVPAVVAMVLVVALPIVGFLQLPLKFRAMGGVQLVHIALALSVLGAAERLYAAVRRAA